MEIQIDDCPPFTNYGSKSKISIVHPYVESSSFGGFVKKRIPTGVTRYEIEFQVTDYMLTASQLWFATFNNMGITVGLQKPSIFKFSVTGTEVAPLTLVGLLQLIEYQTNITGAIEFKFIFTGTLPIGMPEVPTSSEVYAANLEQSESESITTSESYSFSPSEEIPESGSPIEPDVSASIDAEDDLPEPSAQVPFAPTPSMTPTFGGFPKIPKQEPKPEEPIEPKPKRKVSFQ